MGCPNGGTDAFEHRGHEESSGLNKTTVLLGMGDDMRMMDADGAWSDRKNQRSARRFQRVSRCIVLCYAVFFDKESIRMSEGRELMGEHGLRDAVADAGLAAIDAGAEVAADNLPVLAGLAQQAGLEGAASILADSTLGAIAPRALGFVMSYKMNRAERNVSLLFGELSNKMDEVNRRLDALESTSRTKFVGGLYQEAFLDSIVDEVEESKVRLCVNAFLNLMGEDGASDSFALTFFDDLARLNVLDLRVLRLHGHSYLTGYENNDDLGTLMAEEALDESHYRAIREKLCRFGLLESKNEEKREKNLDEVQNCLTELIKQLSSAKNAKLPKPPRIQRVTRAESYVISSLGARYLRLMGPVSAE